MLERDHYHPCRLTQPIDIQSLGTRTALFVMEDLRQLDFLVSRQISYERTVDEFLLQLYSNDALRALRALDQMVILLNEEGALSLHAGVWTLIFTPNRSERKTIVPETDLYRVYSRLLARLEEGAACCVTVPRRSLRALVAGNTPFCILDEFCKSQEGGYLAQAQRLVLEGPDFLFRHVPVCRYGALATVDLNEIENYHAIKSLMDDYIYAYDTDGAEKLRPLSVAVFGPPGAGKSFGVRQIAQSRGRFSIASLNLSQLHGPAELFAALHQALQCPEDKIPLVFFDEFDAECGGVNRGWLKYFLAPMQDGEYTLNGRIVAIRGGVFVFAGATASSFPEFLPGEGEESKIFQAVKGPDFVSRLKGILNIKGPNPTSRADKRHIIRRAMLLRDQMVHNAKVLYCRDTGRLEISKSLLSALLRVSEFRHGARSMEFILGMSRLARASRYTPSCLPLAEQLDIHVDVRDFMRKLSFEQVMGDMVEQYAQIAHEKSRQRHLRAARRRSLSPEQKRTMLADESFAPWPQLKEIYKESYRSQIRYLGERFEEFETGVGLRPILPGADDTITELYGPVLEQLSELEHQRWVDDKLADGWVIGKLDRELRHHPEIVPYGELEGAVKNFIRENMRNVPGYLKEMGYELYQKLL